MALDRHDCHLKSSRAQVSRTHAALTVLQHAKPIQPSCSVAPGALLLLQHHRSRIDHLEKQRREDPAPKTALRSSKRQASG